MKFRVDDSQDGQRLDALLGALSEVGSRSAAQRLIAAGHVTLDDATPVKSARVHAGQEVSVELTTSSATAFAPSEPAVPFEIVYEDDALLVVDKPAGLVVHPAPGHASGTLAQALVGRAGGGDSARPGIVHRLDKDTSGLLVVAKTDATLRALQEALQQRDVERSYFALVRGRPTATSGTIDAPLGRDRNDRKKIALQSGGAREAVTHFETLEELSGATLLSLRLETGRTHQIRVHLAAIDLPVCGDEQYGEPGSYGLQRQFLHACRLAFVHPVSGESLSFESPLPDDLVAALEVARSTPAR